MTATVCITHIENDRFELAVRHHRLHTDQPIGDGGQDTAPTPVELFILSLAACVGVYARRYLARHDLPTTGLYVEAAYSMASRPTRVGAIAIHLGVPRDVPMENWAALKAIATHCTVHNTLEDPPTVNIDLVSATEAAA